MIRILTANPDSTHSTSFYRSLGPLRLFMKDHGDEFTLRDTNAFSWDVIGQADVMFMQRPYSIEHLQVARMAKDMGLKLVVDHDDFLFGIKTDNTRAYKVYKNPEIVKSVREIITLADQLWVATPKLAEMYQGIGEAEIIVIPNAYDSELYPYRIDLYRDKTVLWRGGDSHYDDIQSVKAAYIELFKKYADHTFLFVGAMPWFFTDVYPNVKAQEGTTDILGYFKMIYGFRPKVMAHPLTPGVFNECKSMCSYLEASHAGAAFVGPDFEEYKRPGVTLYKAGDSNSFFEKMDYLLSAPNVAEKRAAEGYGYAKGEGEVGRANAIRYASLKRLFEVKPKAQAVRLSSLG